MQQFTSSFLTNPAALSFHIILRLHFCVALYRLSNDVTVSLIVSIKNTVPLYVADNYFAVKVSRINAMFHHFKIGWVVHSLCKCIDFGVMPTLSELYTQSGATPLALVALLLFHAPDGLTSLTLLALPALGERSHQLRAF
jgi:hypothetical protein